MKKLVFFLLTSIFFISWSFALTTQDKLIIDNVYSKFISKLLYTSKCNSRLKNIDVKLDTAKKKFKSNSYIYGILLYLQYKVLSSISNGTCFNNVGKIDKIVDNVQKNVFLIKTYSYDDYFGVFVPKTLWTAFLVWKNKLLTAAHVVLDENEKVAKFIQICQIQNVNKEPVCNLIWVVEKYTTDNDIALVKILPTWLDWKKYYFDTKIELFESLPHLGDNISIYWFPAIWWNTLTFTKWTVAWFDGNYIKTDATVDHWNSGWPALANWKVVWLVDAIKTDNWIIWYIISSKLLKNFINNKLKWTKSFKLTSNDIKKLKLFKNVVKKSYLVENKLTPYVKLWWSFVPLENLNLICSFSKYNDGCMWNINLWGYTGDIIMSSLTYKNLNFDGVLKYINNHIFKKEDGFSLVLINEQGDTRLYYLYQNNKLVGIVNIKLSNYVYLTIISFPEKKEEKNATFIKVSKKFLSSIKYFSYKKPVVPYEFWMISFTTNELIVGNVRQIVVVDKDWFYLIKREKIIEELLNLIAKWQGQQDKFIQTYYYVLNILLSKQWLKVNWLFRTGWIYHWELINLITQKQIWYLILVIWKKYLYIIISKFDKPVSKNEFVKKLRNLPFSVK